VFAATVSLFLAAMLLVVQSGDLILVLVGGR
jgi:NADH:ubiquinone oxidoreductase subunit 5 (subunit L)/multisubunit Na+/H+ antiporter MnhA subunit